MTYDQERPFHAFSIEECLDAMDSREEGLDPSEVKERRRQTGLNTLRQKEKTSILKLALRQFKDILVLILFIAAVIAFIAGQMVDVYVIIGVILLNALIGFLQEYRAEKAIASLKKLIEHTATVIRQGEKKTVHSKNIVPGDIIVMEEGQSVPADARILEYKNLQTEESSLTGESMPVEKSDRAVKKETQLADRANMIYKGTHVARGTCTAMVTATGERTELGKIAESLQEVRKEKSNFKQKTGKLAKIMGAIALTTAAIVFLLGFFARGFSLEEISLVTIATLVSSIPEGLPAVLSVLLAIGANRMARKNAIIRDFTATEMAGSLSVILTDKTGTLTQGVLTVKKLYLGNGNEYAIEGQGHELEGAIDPESKDAEASTDQALKKALIISRFCNQASMDLPEENAEPVFHGDPTEVALLVLSRKMDSLISKESGGLEILDDLPFNSEQKYRASLIKNADNQREILCVGAPEKILSLSTHYYKGASKPKLEDDQKQHFEDRLHELSGQGMRIIACGTRLAEDTKEEVKAGDINSLEFVGFFAITDPPRPGVKNAVHKCKTAGIRVIMVTGDHKQTALSIAREIGIIGQENETDDVPDALTDADLDVDEDTLKVFIDSVNVFARVSPNTKLKIARKLQEQDTMIGMTGDGVNDAPALKAADVGFAMGQRGTDVARDAAQIVLSDDTFSSIVDSIQEGRIVFRNVRQTSFFLITTNFASTSTLIAAIAIGLPIPLLATQILWINLVTDGIMDISLATEPGSASIMKEKPIKKNASILNTQILPYIFIIVPIMVGLALLTFNHYVGDGLEKARTGVFLAVAMTQLFNAFNMRSLKKSAFSIGLFSNKWVNYALILSLALQILAIKLSFMQDLLHFDDLPWPDILVITALSSTVFFFGELYKYLRKIIKSKSSGQPEES